MRQKKRNFGAVQKQLRIDINRYLAKYDFDVAKKICPMVSGTNYREELQDAFKLTAMVEVIQLCSMHMSKGKKAFQSLYTMDGNYIRDLEEIPADCQIILVSENPPPKEQQKRLTVQVEHECDSAAELTKEISVDSSIEQLQDEK